MRLTRQLSVPVARTLPLRPFFVVTSIATALAWMATLQPPETGFRLLPVRLAIMILAAYSAFLLDDPAALLTDPTPHPLRRRRLLTGTYGYVLAFAVLGIVVAIASEGMDLVWTISEPTVDATEATMVLAGPSPFPAGRLVLEMSTSVAFALAVASLIANRGHDQPGRIASTVALAAFLISALVPEAYQPWADPSDQRWATGANWWWTALFTFLTIATVSSWEARHRPLLHLPRRAKPADLETKRDRSKPMERPHL
jgi:hypothetical protein